MTVNEPVGAVFVARSQAVESPSSPGSPRARDIPHRRKRRALNGLQAAFLLWPPESTTPEAHMLIAILNQSTLVSNADAPTMTEAVAAQVRYDAAPAWDRAPAAVVFYT